MREALTSRRRRASSWRRALAACGVGAGLVLAAALAWAYWSTGGSGTANGMVGTLGAPGNVTAFATAGTGSVVVAWAESTAPDGGPVDGYSVQRFDGATWAAACSSSVAAPVPAGTTTCEDHGVPDGTYTYAVTAVYRSWTSAATASAAVTVDGVSRFTISAPASASAGSLFSVTVTARDAGNNLVPLYTGTIHFTSSDLGAVVLPPDYAFTTADAGTHTFTSALGLATAGAQTVGVNDVDDPTITGSTTVSITAGAAAQLGFVQQPGGGTSSTAWATQPKVAIQDAFGNTVTGASGSVALAITPGTGTTGAVLTCTTNPRSTSAGVATFANCKIDKAGSYSVNASASGLTAATSGSFNVVPGAATKIVYTQQPTAVVAGDEISPAVTVAVEDAAGNVVTSSGATVTIAISTNPGSGTLSGTTSVPVTGGVATFDDLSIDRSANGYKLLATSTGLTSATSSSFNVTAGTPVQLTVTQQPSGGTGGTAWTTQPKVAVQDALGNTVTTASTSVTLAVTPGTGAAGAVLTCSANPRTTSSGVATFASCKIDKAATGYVLTASAPGLPSESTNAFDIAIGPAAKLVYTQQPTAVVAGNTISPAVTVTVQDAGGNTVTSSSAAVNVAIGTNPGNGTLSGTTTLTPANGVATFADLSIDKAATGYKLVVSSTGLTNVTSAAFTVSAGAAVQLGFTQQPSGGTAGVAWATQPKVAVQDAFGNTVTSATASVTLTVTPGTGAAGAVLTCTANPKATSSGVAAFSGCKIDRAGTAYTVTATAPGLTGSASNPFNVG